jgi:hypothetical protein
MSTKKITYHFTPEGGARDVKGTIKYTQKQYDAPHNVSTGVCVAKIGDQVPVGVVSNEYRVTRIEDPGTHQEV